MSDTALDAAPDSAFGAEPGAPVKPAGPAGRRRQSVFWGAAGFAFAAVAIALFAPSAAGLQGLMLLGGVAGGALVLFVGMMFAGPGGLSLFSTPDAGEDAAVRAAQSAAFDVLPDPVLITDRSGSARFANAAFNRLAAAAGAMGESGRPPSIDRVLSGHKDAAAAIYRLARAARRGEAARESVPVVDSAGGDVVRVFDVGVAPIAGGGAVWRIYAQDEAGGAPIVSGDSLLEAAPIGFFAASPDGRVSYMNATLREWLGPQAAGSDLKLRDFVIGDASRALGRGGRSGSNVVRADITLRARDGVETPAVVVTSWPPTDGKPISRSVVFGLTNTAAPPGVAQAIAGAGGSSLGVEGAGVLDAMFTNAPFGVARLDLNDPLNAMIEDANPALLHLTEGRGAPGARFADIFDLSHPDAREALSAPRRGAGADPVELTLNGVRRKAHEGEPEGRPQEVHVFFADERGGRLAAYLVDVAHHKDIERRLNRAERLNTIGALVGRVAHDMNNFMASARIACDLLLGNHPVGDPSFPTLQKVSQNITRATGIVKQLRAFAGTETNRPVPLELGETVAEFADMIRMAVRENIKVEFIYERDVPTVKADPGQIENLLMNLATNARDAMSKSTDGRLTVRLAPADASEIDAREVDDVASGRYAMIEVTDTGSGMNQATIEKIFEPYFTTKKESEGTGLGLSSVFGIVKQSNGHITVKSKLGEGSTFRIYLPFYEISDAERAEIAARRAAARNKKPKDMAGTGRILLVEDEDDLRTLSALALRRSGYEVTEACDGEEALEIIVERGVGGFDLLITDVVMPEMDGPTLLHEAREHLGEARVIFTSGYAKQEFSETLSRERDVVFLPKPYKLEDLARKVKEEIGAAE